METKELVVPRFLSPLHWVSSPLGSWDHQFRQQRLAKNLLDEQHGSDLHLALCEGCLHPVLEE